MGWKEKTEAANKRVNEALDRGERPIDEDVMMCDIETLTRAAKCARAAAGVTDDPRGVFRLR